MNTTPNALSTVLDKSTPLRNKFESGFACLAGFLFFFMTVYTVVKMPNVLMKYGSDLTSTTFVLTVGLLLILILMQGITAYGFWYLKPWIRNVLTIHSTALLIYAFVILPIINTSGPAYTLLVSGIPYLVSTIALWFFITLKGTTRHATPISIMYLVCTALTILFQITFTS